MSQEETVESVSAGSCTRQSERPFQSDIDSQMISWSVDPWPLDQVTHDQMTPSCLDTYGWWLHGGDDDDDDVASATATNSSNLLASISASHLFLWANKSEILKVITIFLFDKMSQQMLSSFSDITSPDVCCNVSRCVLYRPGAAH